MNRRGHLAWHAQIVAAIDWEKYEPMDNKDHFETVLKQCEAKGLLPKGKTADLMENYPFIVGELEAPSAEVDHDALDEKTKVRARKA